MADIAATQTSKTQDWETPLWLFNLLDREFRFTLDVCANENNALCDEYYDEELDGLNQKWYGQSWCNPPYHQVGRWAEKAFNEAKKGNCTAVLLVAARTDTRYFWNFLRFGEIRFLPGRLKFGLPGGTRYSAPFPSAVVIFDQDFPAKTVYWNVRESTHASSI